MILSVLHFSRSLNGPDEKDEEVGGKHHYRKIDPLRAKESIIRLDQLIDEEENK